jgi:hypothetical protein
MALSTPAKRTHQHTRTIVCEGFRREDGDWDIEGRILDQKTFAYDEPVRGHREIGAPVHDMAVRLTMNSKFVISAIEVDMPATPYTTCGTAMPAYQGLVGKQIGAGWRKAVNEAVGGVQGCTHVRELLFPMATVTFQTLVGWGEPPKPGEEPVKPFALNGCKAWDAAGPMVAQYHPRWAIKPVA